jgi:hypothetical protein
VGIIGIARDGTQLWTYKCNRVVEPTYSRFVIADLNGDGHKDVAASLIVRDAAASVLGSLLAIDHQGRKMWEREIGDTLQFGNETYGPTWGPDAVTSYSSGGQPMVAWAVHHHTWWPSIVAVFDGRGERNATFVNAGWIRDLTPSSDSRYLLAGGINNAREGAAFAILDAKRPSGSSPEDSRSKYECHNCPPGMPLRYYVVPWTDVIEPIVLGGRRGQFVSMPDGTIEMRAVQYQNAEVIVELSPSFEIRSRRLSDGFWQVHGEMERQGLLKHSRGQCPYRNGVSILEWLPEYGWREHKPTSAQ